MDAHSPPMTSDPSSGSNNLPLLCPEQAVTASDWLNCAVEVKKHLTGYKLTFGGAGVDPERSSIEG